MCCMWLWLVLLSLVYIFSFPFFPPSFFCSALCVHVYYNHVSDLLFLSVCVCVYALFYLLFLVIVLMFSYPCYQLCDWVWDTYLQD